MSARHTTWLAPAHLYRMCTRSMVEASALVRMLTEFAVSAGGPCFEGWLWDKVFRYLAFHALTGHLAAEMDGDGVRGLLVAWPTSVAEVERRAKAGEPYWNWEAPRMGGDAIMVAEVITAPGRERGQIIGRLAEAAMRRQPEWKSREIFTWRHGRLHRLSAAAITRLLYGRS